MAGEIAHYAAEGVRSFIILQPFGCLPNHVCGRGVTKRLKEEFPGVQILPLDLDPDTSYANVENRLQMLIMNQTAEAAAPAEEAAPGGEKARGQVSAPGPVLHLKTAPGAGSRAPGMCGAKCAGRSEILLLDNSAPLCYHPLHQTR